LYQEVQHANLQNAHSLRLALRLQRTIDLEWQSDGGQANIGTAAAETDFVIDGAQTISVVLPGIGCLEVVGAGREARKQQSEIEAKARSLESQLKPYEVTWQQLPSAFDGLEARSQTLSSITQNCNHCKVNIKTHGRGRKPGRDTGQISRLGITS
jgi:hypothetical protein